MAFVKVTFLGHASFKFESEKGTVIYFDAWLVVHIHAPLVLAECFVVFVWEYV